MLQHIEEQIRQSDVELGILIHVGAGTGSELQEYLDLKFSRIVLYEAVPELVEELRERSSGCQQVSVEQAVVAGQKGKVTFHCMNNPRFSSLSEQKVLKDYYPNLLSTVVKLEAVSLAEVIAKEESSGNATNVLILEVQGAERDLLDTITADQLQNFRFLIVRTLVESSSEDQESSYDSILRQAEFIPLTSSQDVYPFRTRTFIRDDSAIALKALQQKFDTLMTELENEKVRSTKAESELEDIKEASEARIADREKQVAEIEKRLGSITSENQDLQEELDKVRKENKELAYRQTFLDEEVVKAEAQLELIKDVVIRDKAF